MRQEKIGDTWFYDQVSPFFFSPPKLDVDERTIMSIEGYKANTTIEILYPLLRMLKIDSREIFNPELSRESQAHYQLRVLIDNCSEEETTTLISVCQAVISALRTQSGIIIEDKKACLPFD